MKLFKANFYLNYGYELIEVWARSKYDVQKQIERKFPTAYDVCVWSI
jgi:hypothetical protein